MTTAFPRAASATSPSIRKRTRSTPTQRFERIALIDVLRGFALFGVALANTVGSSGFSPFLNPDPLHDNLNWFTFKILHILIDGKFYTIFAFLFGVGFGLQLLSAKARNIDFQVYYVQYLVDQAFYQMINRHFLASIRSGSWTMRLM